MLIGRRYLELIKGKESKPMLQHFKPCNRSKERMAYYAAPEGKTIKVELYYTKGGISFATNKQVRRGIFISITPVTLEKTQSGFTSESFMLFSGTRSLLCELKRFSEKALHDVAEKIDDLIPKVAANINAETATQTDFDTNVLYLRDCYLNPELRNLAFPAPGSEKTKASNG
jgi:hypothetical protein